MNIESSRELLELAQRGNSDALDALLRQYIPRLRRWASARLPQRPRHAADTDDLVHEAVMRISNGRDAFDRLREGTLHAHLRQAIAARIRDENRRAEHHSSSKPGKPSSDQTASPLDDAIGREAVQRYETALARLALDEREAVIARVELGCSYQEVASAIRSSSADAARTAVSRALLHLAEEMHRGA
jgi:RNA polymerase sigma-70 factor (ECF subfamily)